MARIRETQKRYWILALLTALVWLGLGLIIFLVDPENVRDFPIEGSYLLPGGVMFVAIFLLLTIILAKWKMALRWSMAITSFIYLRIWGLGGGLNGFLLLGLFISLETYLWLNTRGRQEPKEQL